VSVQIKCPDTKKACPGNTAVTIFTKFANTAEQFEAQQATFIAGVAKAASVSTLQVVVTNVKLLYTPKPPSPPPAAAAVAEAPAGEPVPEPAAAAAEDNATVIAPAAATAKAAPAAAKPAAGNVTAATAKAKPESAPLRKLLQALFQAAPKEAPAAAPAAEEPAADSVDPAADANATAPAEPAAAEEKPASLDAEAIVEELPGGPKPMIEVMTSIQPLTEEEAQSVLGTTGSPYFIKTFKETLTATNLTLTEDIVTKIAEPAKEFEWPQPEVPEADANLSEW
jgi:hypothetical protein